MNTVDNDHTVAADNAMIVEKIDIPLCLVGYMIGRGGNKLKDLQLKTSCKISVVQDMPDDQPRELVVSGKYTDVKYAMVLIKQRLAESPLLSGQLTCPASQSANTADSLAESSSSTTPSTSTGTNPSNNTDIQATVIDCPKHLLGLLIGKNGWTLKRIMSSTMANITINQSVLPDQSIRIVIYGSDAAVLNACAYVQRILHKGVYGEPSYPSGFDGDDYDRSTTDSSYVPSHSNSNSNSNSTLTTPQQSPCFRRRKTSQYSVSGSSGKNGGVKGGDRQQQYYYQHQHQQENDQSYHHQQQFQDQYQQFQGQYQYPNPDMRMNHFQVQPPSYHHQPYQAGHNSYNSSGGIVYPAQGQAHYNY